MRLLLLWAPACESLVDHRNNHRWVRYRGVTAVFSAGVDDERGDNDRFGESNEDHGVKKVFQVKQRKIELVECFRHIYGRHLCSAFHSSDLNSTWPAKGR